MKVNGVNITFETTSETKGTEAVKSDTKTDGTQGKGSEVTAKTDENSLQTVEIEETAATDQVSQINQALSDSEKQYQEKIQQCLEQIDQLKTQMSEIDEQKRTLATQLMDGSDISQFMTTFSDLNKKKNDLYEKITGVMVTIKGLEKAIADNRITAQDAINQINSLSAMSSGLTGLQSNGAYSAANIPNISSNTPLGEAMVSIGNSFVGVINNDAQGNATFSPGGASQHWCADFVTSIVKRACQATGQQVPAGFGSSSVSGLQSWAQQNGRYLQIAGKANKAQIIAQNIKPGDIIIQKENGASHTGIVTKVYPDGSYDTVEGNTSDAVKNRHYTADYNKLSGFIKMA